LVLQAILHPLQRLDLAGFVTCSWAHPELGQPLPVVALVVLVAVLVPEVAAHKLTVQDL
jgi:hypothetical protein